MFGSKKKTVASVMAPLTAAIDDLKAIADARWMAAAAKQDQADALTQSAAGDRVEVNRANDMISKLEALVS